MKNEHITFYIRHVTWKREKIYSSQFFQNIPFRIAWKTTSSKHKNFFALWTFLWNWHVSIRRNFNLSILKVNENAASVNDARDNSSI